jgi:hypothetical protein
MRSGIGAALWALSILPAAGRAQEEGGAPKSAPFSPVRVTVTVAPAEDTTTPLQLPDAGLQSRVWSPPKPGHVPRANLLYARFTWKDWGADGKGRVDHFKGWMAQKRYVGFRMYCNNSGDLPAGVDIPVVSGGGQTLPAYWDPKFIEAHRRFVQALGREIAANPYLAYIDIGGVGNTGGEWLVYPDDRWGETPVFRDKGFTPEARDRLVWETVKMYREAFPHVRLYLACAAYGSYVKDRKALLEYMKKNNVGFRSDGLCGFSTDESDPWSTRKAGTHKLWLDAPFQWEGSYSTMEWEKDGKGWNTEKIMARAMDFGPLSICYADKDGDALRFETDPAKKAILDRAGLRLGYRFAVVKASYLNRVVPGDTMTVQAVVANRGCAKTYADREFEVSFLNGGGRPPCRSMAVRVKPSPPCTAWLPGETPVTFRVPVPRDAYSGNFRLAIAMLDEDPRRPENRLEMAMTEKTPDNRYLLGRIAVGAR